MENLTTLPITTPKCCSPPYSLKHHNIVRISCDQTDLSSRELDKIQFLSLE